MANGARKRAIFSVQGTSCVAYDVSRENSWMEANSASVLVSVSVSRERKPM